MKKQSAAFFDLDRTLIDVNSALLYAKHEFRNRRISVWMVLKTAFWSLLYHLSILNMEDAYKHAARHYIGEDDDTLEKLSSRWFQTEVAHRLQPGAQLALAHHRERGEPLVLLSNTSCYVARAAISEYGLDDWLANQFPLDDSGRLTGALVSPLCYGEGKVTHAERWAQENDIDLETSTFYTDSLSDLPMLERVGNPRIVNPDPRLRRLARRRKWPILDWSKKNAASKEK